MERLKKIFGGVDLTWKKLIVFAVIISVYTGIVAMLPVAHNTSFSDLAVSIEVWIFCGIFIIMNSKSPMDSALKCFVFFLISQPLIYLVQDVVKHSQLFLTYYRFWFCVTLFTIPMGFVGYYMKKNKWWGLLILTPILVLLGYMFRCYIGELVFAFPRHLLTVVFCAVTLIIYPLGIFSNKRIKITGVVISSLIVIGGIAYNIVVPTVYDTNILLSGGEYDFDGTYNVYLADAKYGELSINYNSALNYWSVDAKFRREGKTEVILESPDGKKTVFDIAIKMNSYELRKKC